MNYPEDFINKVIQGDCLEVMKNIPDNSIDLVVTDPPYGISYKSNYGSKEYIERIHQIDWDDNFDFTAFWKEIWRTMKDESDGFVFGRWENYEVMKKLEGFKQILIWDKQCGGLGDLTCFIPTYELIFYFKKGRRKPNKRSPAIIRNHSQTSWMYGNPKHTYLHPTQKPIDLIKKIINISSKKDDLVLDPFLGSGTTAVACKQLNRKFIGIELNPDYCKIAEERIKAVPKRLTEFWLEKSTPLTNPDGKKE